MGGRRRSSRRGQQASRGTPSACRRCVHICVHTCVHTRRGGRLGLALAWRTADVCAVQRWMLVLSATQPSLQPCPLPCCPACLPRLQSNEALRGEIEALRGAPSPLAAARDAKAETLADKEKFVKLLDNLAAHKASLQRKLAERQADVAAQGAELAAVEAENEGLRGRIAVQTVHPQDVMRMNQDKCVRVLGWWWCVGGWVGWLIV